MIDGTINLTCDKCGTKFTKSFTLEIPSRDGLLNEFGFATLYIDKEYVLCPDCGASWKAKQADLNTVFNTNAIDFLKTKAGPK